MMVALYERPDIKRRNARILELFREGEISRKEIGAKVGVSLDVVNNVIKQARARRRTPHGRRCVCGGRRQ